jgi:hypothetical protein
VKKRKRLRERQSIVISGVNVRSEFQIVSQWYSAYSKLSLMFVCVIEIQNSRHIEVACRNTDRAGTVFLRYRKWKKGI